MVHEVLHFTISTNQTYDTLFKNTIQWLNSRSKENDRLWESNDYYTILAVDKSEISFAIFNKSNTWFHTKDNHAKIQFFKKTPSIVEVTLHIPRFIAPDLPGKAYPLYIHRYAEEIFTNILGGLTPEQYESIYSLKIQNMRKKGVLSLRFHESSLF